MDRTKLKHGSRIWSRRLLLALVPAIASAWSSYSKGKAEANAGYKTLVAEVERQSKTIEEIQRDNSEWRKLLVETLAARGSGSGSTTLKPIALLPPETLKRLANAPVVKYRPTPLPANLDMAQRKAP